MQYVWPTAFNTIKRSASRDRATAPEAVTWAATSDVIPIQGMSYHLFNWVKWNLVIENLIIVGDSLFIKYDT